VGNKPTVCRLHIHLPDEQMVTFDQRDEIQEVAARERETMLTAWFKCNAADVRGRDLPYVDFPSRFKWTSQRGSGGRWELRQRGDADRTIGRLYFVSPRAGEKYYLRILLHNVPGAVSYETLRTGADGYVAATFQEACRRRGLLNDDQEWRECLAEAAGEVPAAQLRSLFGVQGPSGSLVLALFCR
jgi:hypothetical protein